MNEFDTLRVVIPRDPPNLLEALDRIEAEHKRLRAALEEIEQWEGKPRKIAERALAAEEKS